LAVGRVIDGWTDGPVGRHWKSVQTRYCENWRTNEGTLVYWSSKYQKFKINWIQTTFASGWDRSNGHFRF
jgi:hypothetical protein